MANRYTSPWTPARIKWLADNSHLSASRAAEKIGDGCTRNAVIAKRNRLKGIVFPSDVKRANDAKKRRQRLAAIHERIEQIGRSA